MFFIQFGLLSRNLLLPFISPIFIIVRSISPLVIETEYKFDKHPLIFLFLMFFGELLVGCVHIILYNREKKHHVEDIDQKSVFTMPQFTPVTDINKAKRMCMMLLKFLGITLIDTSMMSVLIINSTSEITFNLLEFQLKAVQILILSLLCKFILRYPIFKHQWLSLGLIIIGIIFVFIRTFAKEDILVLLKQIGIYIMTYLFWACQEISEKYLMENQFISPFEILLFEGSFGLVISIVLIAIFNNITCPRYFDFCIEGKPIEEILETLKIIGSNGGIIGLLVLFFFTSAGYNIFRLSINKIYTPTHKAIADILSAFIWECVWYILDTNKTEWYIILNVIGYLIMIIGTLLYNEIIILYLWGFQSNTKKEILMRTSEEHCELIISPIENISY